MDSPADRLRKIRAERGFKSARQAALRFGWEPPTYTSHENGTRPLTRVFQEYAKAFRVSEAWLRGLTNDRDTGVRGAPVTGEAAIGVWREADAGGVSVSEQKHIDVPLDEDEEFQSVRFSIYIADASVSKTLPRGSYAICRPLTDRNHRPRDFTVGDLLYIERNRNGLRETSVRRVSSVSADKMRLSTHSTDARLKQELTYPSGQTGEAIRLLGRVIGIYNDLTTN